MSYIGRDYCGELIEILALLLQRHQHKNKKTNETIAKQDNEMRVTKFSLTKELGPDSQLSKAASVLTKNGYEILLKTIADSEHYCFETYPNGSRNVYRRKYSDKKRYFESVDDRCSCDDCVANQK